MDWKKLLLNAALAGLWAAASAYLDANPGLAGLAAIALRTAIGYLAARLDKPVPVDR